MTHSPYLPNTDADRKAMLAEMGLGSMEDLFADIPAEVRFKGSMKLPPALSEPELVRHMKELAGMNADAGSWVVFLGGGSYDHFIPSVVGHVVGRSEFYTAYTPYQPEVSQGVLQSIYEYQTLICRLTDMEVSNASMYDGASAMAEAALIACAATRRARIVVPMTVHPEYRETVRTYARGPAIEIVEVPYDSKTGQADLGALEKTVDDATAAVLLAHPNFFGCLENPDEVSRIAHDKGALFVVAVDPISLGLLKPPGAYGADIALGEGQPLGNPMSFGGPYLGFLATSEKLVRRMPGRIAGATVDLDGDRGFVLTLQTREQHIRREKATSNICSNEALNALAAAVYLTTMGKEGLVEVARLCLEKTAYARDQIWKVPGYSVPFSAPVFKEFAVRGPGSLKEVNARLAGRKMLVGPGLGTAYPELNGCFLVATTEKRTKAEIDGLAAGLGGRA
ncbi:MAG: aminomethyl-transferring glycine dehydrogenase subunit GcvPA [Bacillota bacterium]|nr:MAG: aminomethyl-transferring glycine dehydrogenase subunit GcvPA [Bacillota bacterium]